MTVMRLQRALARAGVASRRQAEVLIEAGAVSVDGVVATLGTKVDPDLQKIVIKGRWIRPVATRWLVLHKPLGVVTTAADEEGRPTVFDLIPDHKGLTYVGRLDVMTTGVLLLTTDGDAVHRLTHPRFRIPRRYTVLVHGNTTEAIAKAAAGRVVVAGRPVVPLSVRVQAGRAGRTLIDVTLAEGRNAVVRKWVAEMGGKVERLARLSYGPIRLGDLKPGEWRPLTPPEIKALYRAIDLPAP
ncbi:MAG: rRNA pseudouridine synthase [Caldilineales bacterium]|nr:rRNA pseudouridine synthase [Caldilineales bacterium]